MVNQFPIHLLFATAILCGATSTLSAAELTEDNFAEVKSLIEPQDGEGLWRHIPWETDLTAARRRAAAEGKPLLIWAGGGSAPLGGC
jgi:hypothetical protein